MYNTRLIKDLVYFIESLDDIYDKAKVTSEVQKHFNLTRDRSVYFCKDFAIRFCKSGKKQFSNTVLALSNLRKYDDRPFIVCLVTPKVNHLMLANTSFLKKISHSSHGLRVDNIRGSFNGSDIMREIEGMDNSPENFEKLYLLHESFTFEENLVRLVEATNKIRPFGKKFIPDTREIEKIRTAVDRAAKFSQSDEYSILNQELCEKVSAVESEIIIAYKRIDNVNLRGRVIEYLITSDHCSTREELILSLINNSDLPEIFTDDDLGDYQRNFSRFHTQTDIKSKILSCSSNPKGYNIDKLLKLLAMDNSVYLIYLVAIDEYQSVKTALYSVFNERLVNSTRIIKHWAGRNSRGVAQFDGNVLEEMIGNPQNNINQKSAQKFLMNLL